MSQRAGVLQLNYMQVEVCSNTFAEALMREALALK